MSYLMTDMSYTLLTLHIKKYEKEFNIPQKQILQLLKTSGFTPSEMAWGGYNHFKIVLDYCRNEKA